MPHFDYLVDAFYELTYPLAKRLNMIRYTYLLKNYPGWLQGLAKVLKAKVIHKKMIAPPALGEGYVYASSINSDISYFIADISLKEDLVLQRKKTTSFGLTLSFAQIAVGDFFKASESSNTIIDRSPTRNNILLSSTNYDLEYTYSKNSKFKVVSIAFSPAFTAKCLKKDILVDAKMYTGERLNNVNKVPITFEYRRLLDEIFKMEKPSTLSNLVLRNRILLLTEKFLSSYLEEGLPSKQLSAHKVKAKQKDIHALKGIEELLSSGSLDKFPSIEELSRTAMMSTTKLKSKFKSFYGMKLYEFYNRNRLEKAREMLQSGRYSVKQAGLEIGFSNLSNFAKAFKKEFGVLPKEMLRIN
jgi:AraC-like DNA-binding protein